MCFSMSATFNPVGYTGRGAVLMYTASARLPPVWITLHACVASDVIHLGRTAAPFELQAKA